MQCTNSVRRAAGAPVPCDSVSIDDVAAAAGTATDLLRSTRVGGSARPGCPSGTPSPVHPRNQASANFSATAHTQGTGVPRLCGVELLARLCTRLASTARRSPDTSPLGVHTHVAPLCMLEWPA